MDAEKWKELDEQKEALGLICELDEEFSKLYGKPIATQEHSNFKNDEDANERIFIVEYLPDPTKYAFLVDCGNGWWNQYKLVNKTEVKVMVE